MLTLMLVILVLVGLMAAAFVACESWKCFFGGDFGGWVLLGWLANGIFEAVGGLISSIIDQK